MLVYSSDQLNRSNPPAPDALLAPAPTGQGAPAAFLADIKKARSLKPTETIEKDGLKIGKVLGENNAEATSSKVTLDKPIESTGLLGTLSRGMDKMIKAVSGSDDNDDPTQNV
jgi:hypothetical protein